MVYGNTGSGKTCSVHAIAHDLNYEVLEVNASDARNKEAINNLIGNASTQQSLFSKSKIILVDEIDGIAGREDRGGVAALVSAIAASHFPIILVANDPWDKKFSPLRSKSLLIHFRTQPYTSIAAVLKRIAQAENLDIQEDILNRLARRAAGDFRAAINDLHTLAQTPKITEQDIAHLDERNQTETIMNALVKIFKTTDFDIAQSALQNIDENYDEVMRWLDENLPAEYTRPDDLYRAYDQLSKADVFNGRIRNRQHWRFLVYISAFLSAGVALAKAQKYPGFTNYKPSKRILKYWLAKRSNMQRDSIAEKIGLKTHCSKRQAIYNMAYFREMFSNKAMAKDITQELDLSKEETDWLKLN
ncbi:MAG: replication factor C large subunit [Candidatus Woesearchaeota archaeon]